MVRPDFAVLEDIEPIAYLTQEDIASGKLTRAVIKQGIIALASSGIVTLFLYTPKGKRLKYEFAGNDEQISYIDNDRFGSVLPSMVRIYAAGRSHYLFKNSKLGSTHIKLTRRLFERLHRQWSSHPATTPLRPNKPMRSALIGALLVVMACVGFTLWSSWDQSIEHAPMLLEKTESGKVIAASHHILYVFQADGTLYDRIELENLGLPEGISDMQSLSEVDFLVADRATSVIKWCSLDDKTCAKLPGFKREALFLHFIMMAAGNGYTRRILRATVFWSFLQKVNSSGRLQTVAFCAFQMIRLLLENASTLSIPTTMKSLPGISM